MSATDAIPKKHRSGWAYIWLAYVGFIFIDPILEPSPRLWIGTIAVLAIFLGIFVGYVRSTDEGSPIRFWMIAAIFVLGLIAFPWNPGASTFFIYAAAFLPFAIKSTRLVLFLFLIESLIILAEGYLFRTHGGPFFIEWPNTLIAIFLLIIIGTGNILFAQQRRADNKLRLAQEENLALAAVAERERIARDLHDVLGHTLSVIVLKQSWPDASSNAIRDAPPRRSPTSKRPHERPSARCAKPSAVIALRDFQQKWNSPATPCRQRA